MRITHVLFIDSDDHYALNFSGRCVTIYRNGGNIYNGPIADLLIPGEFHCVSVGRAIKADLDTATKELIAHHAEEYLGHRPPPPPRPTPVEPSPERRAHVLARIAFAGKRDKRGEPLFHHACRVMRRCSGGVEIRTVALLHDIVEDTAVSLDDLGHFFDASIVESVDALTRRHTETYAEYIARLSSTTPTIAIAVKIADLYDHLAFPDAIPDSLQARYRKALPVLTEAFARRKTHLPAPAKQGETRT